MVEPIINGKPRNGLRRGLRAFVAALAFATVLAPDPLAATTPAAADTAAVVLMYHRFGESAHPSTNVTLEQFESHVRELASAKYNVVPVPEIVAALRAGKALPDRTVGITVDDAYLSVFTEAWPRLRAAGLPFTLFVATEPVDRGLAGCMNWDQIRELREAGVTIGSQTESHLHMAAASAAANERELRQSNERFRAMLGLRPGLFAYPYGESSLAAREIVVSAGFVAAFGQHSGAIGPGQDIYFLPRFALNEAYGSLDRLRLAAGALPLPVADVTPLDHLVGEANPPLIGFTVRTDVQRLHRLNCYASHEGRIRIERIGSNRIEVRAATPFPVGRTRINCTLPDGAGRWRWYGRQFFRAR